MLVCVNRICHDLSQSWLSAGPEILQLRLEIELAVNCVVEVPSNTSAPSSVLVPSSKARSAPFVAMPLFHLVPSCIKRLGVTT